VDLVRSLGFYRAVKAIKVAIDCHIERDVTPPATAQPMKNPGSQEIRAPQIKDLQGSLLESG